MDSLNKASTLYVESSAVKDTDYDDHFIKMTHALEEKTESLVSLYNVVCERAPKAGREY